MLWFPQLSLIKWNFRRASLTKALFWQEFPKFYRWLISRKYSLTVRLTCRFKFKLKSNQKFNKWHFENGISIEFIFKSTTTNGKKNRHIFNGIPTGKIEILYLHAEINRSNHPGERQRKESEKSWHRIQRHKFSVYCMMQLNTTICNSNNYVR